MIGLVGLVPRRVAIAAGRTLGAAATPFLRERRRMAMRHAWRLGSDDPAAQARRMFASYGQYWAETLWVRPRRRAEIEACTTLEGEEWVHKVHDEGRGVILALPHMGNWELAGPVARAIGLDLVAVAENLANRRLRDWFVDLRGRMDIDIVLATGAASVMRALEDKLAANGAVALLCDRDLKGRGVSVEFFGETTTLPAGPVSLAIRTGASILPAAAYFGPRATHRIVIRPPLHFAETEGLAQGTARLAAELEILIREAPDQWHLLQPNWPSDREAL